MADIKETLESMASVSHAPIFSGDGYGYGGGAVLVIGCFAIQLGEHPFATKLAMEIAKRWNDYAPADGKREGE